MSSNDERKMYYPNWDEIETASCKQLFDWWRFLPSPRNYHENSVLTKIVRLTKSRYSRPEYEERYNNRIKEYN
jgi:hypothetical protein